MLRVSLVVTLGAALSRASPVVRSTSATTDPFAILDEQKWVNPDDMVWDDYRKPPGTSWNDDAVTGTVRNFKIALVTVDYPDSEFAVTLAPNSTVFGNPSSLSANIPREDVPSYYRDLLNKVQDINLGHTLHEYWMEDSGGRYGVSLDAFGPYRLPRKAFQYGIDDARGGFNEGFCPEPPCSVDLRTDALGAWRSDIGNTTADAYELAFILSAGQDESATWQEFGEMKFQTKEDVPDAFGPPPDTNTTLPNWAKTRYIEWSSFAAASSIWPNAGRGSSTQAESSGAATFAHELSHLIGIGDNYNNPFGVPARRSYTGPWSMMSRGSFNGPGGPHTRWQIPALQGASLGSQHTVRDKLQLGLMSNDTLLNITLADLRTHGTVVTTLTARSVLLPADSTAYKGLRIHFETDRSPACNTSTTPTCDGGSFNFYDLEVIQRIGADSFCPDSGVMISKGKTSDRVQPFQWTIDANPQDVNVVDYVRPNGEESMVSVGDYRQLADALFHAGTRSGSLARHVDEANGLEFFVLEPLRSEDGVLSYTVAARALDTTVTPAAYTVSAGSYSADSQSCTFSLSRPSSAASIAPPQFDFDILTLSAEAESSEYEVVLQNEYLAATKTGDEWSREVVVGVRRRTVVPRGRRQAGGEVVLRVGGVEGRCTVP